MPKKRSSQLKKSRKKRSRRKDKKNKKKSRKLRKRTMKGGGDGVFGFVKNLFEAKKKTDETSSQPDPSLPGSDGKCKPQKGLITRAGDFFGKGIGEATGFVDKAGGAISNVTKDMTKKTTGAIQGQLTGLTAQLQNVNKNMFQQAADTGICPCCGQKMPDKQEDLQKDVKQLEKNLGQAKVKTDQQNPMMAPTKPENIILKIDEKNLNEDDIETISLDSIVSEN